MYSLTLVDLQIFVLKFRGKLGVLQVIGSFGIFCCRFTIYISFSALTLLVGWKEGHLACKKYLACSPRYWHQRADERHGNPPLGNQELLVVKDKSWKTPR